MADVFVSSDTMTEIADAIREKTGKTDLMYPQDMAAEIDGIDISEAAAADEEWINGTVEEVIVPEGVTEIGEFMFYQFKQLRHVTLPDGIETVGQSAFRECSQLGLTHLPNAIKTIHSGAFSDCSELLLSELPPHVEIIGDSSDWWTGTFARCHKMTIQRIPASVKGLLGAAHGPFPSCNGLTSITFEGKPDTVSSGTFSGCINITTINVPWSEEEVAGAPWGATNATINYNYTEAAEI